MLISGDSHLKKINKLGVGSFYLLHRNVAACPNNI